MFRIKNSRLFFRVQFLFNTLLFWSKLVDFPMTYKWNERHEVSCTKLLVCRLTWLCFKFGNILCNTLLMYLKIVHDSPHSPCSVLYRAQVLILVRCSHLHERQRERERERERESYLPALFVCTSIIRWTWLEYKATLSRIISLYILYEWLLLPCPHVILYAVYRSSPWQQRTSNSF
jgi:hypothetical protein